MRFVIVIVKLTSNFYCYLCCYSLSTKYVNCELYDKFCSCKQSIRFCFLVCFCVNFHVIVLISALKPVTNHKT